MYNLQHSAWLTVAYWDKRGHNITLKKYSYCPQKKKDEKSASSKKLSRVAERTIHETIVYMIVLIRHQQYGTMKNSKHDCKQGRRTSPHLLYTPKGSWNFNGQVGICSECYPCHTRVSATTQLCSPDVAALEKLEALVTPTQKDRPAQSTLNGQEITASYHTELLADFAGYAYEQTVAS